MVFRTLLAGFLALCGTAQAAEISSISWDEGSAQPTLKIQLSGKTAYQTANLEGGQRLRISFPGTTLGAAVLDIEGRGTVKGVYPYLADNGTAAHVDLLMTEPGNLKIEEAAGGYRVIALADSSDSAVAVPAAPQVAPAAPPPAAKAASNAAPAAKAAGDRNLVQDMKYAKLPGDRIQIRVQMSKPPGTPAVFTTNNPARIALDFANTGVAMDKTSLRVGEGVVASVNAVESDNKTRLVINLVRSAAYASVIEGNSFTLTIDNPSSTVAGTQGPKTTRFATAARAGKHQLKNIDFRRGRLGDGKVIIKLSDTGVGIDIREQAGEIIVDFHDTQITPDLQRRLDVVDFATPIMTIDTFAQGKNVRMVIGAKGKYEQLAYQAGDEFTVNVKPVVVKPGDEKKKDEFGYSGEKLSLNFQNIDVRAALQVIADFTGLNFVTSDSVKGSLTLRLKDVPWDQALDIIVNAKNLAVRRSGNVVTVGPADEVNAKDKAALEAGKVVQELEPLISELIQINYAKADDIAKLLKSIKAIEGVPSAAANPALATSSDVKSAGTDSNTLLSPRGQVTVDSRTNSLLIQDTPSKVREVRKLISQLDQPVRQVMIETRLVEATDDFARNLGVKWGVVRQDTVGNNQVTTCGTLQCNNNVLDGEPIQLPGNSLSVDMGADGLGTGTVVGSIATSIMHLPDNSLLNLELSALEAEGRGKVISSPRLITANSKKARIEQGQERVFTTSVLGVGTTVTKKAVLALEVTPQITPDDRVILDVLVTKDSFQDANAGLINKKEITTQVLLSNGETVVIGGVYEQLQAHTVVKVPFFADIPLIGWMFKKTNKFDNKIELLIFLTPRILSETLSLK
jgi:type IV pilus assembly protein PilQ